MFLRDLLEEKNITMYRLSKKSEVPYTTINDICSGRVAIEKCSGETLYRIARALDISIESLIAEAVDHRSSFETFKSNTCHYVRDMGAVDFIIEILEKDTIREYFNRRWYPEALYSLAMLDYLSRKHDLPICTIYNDIRQTRLQEPVFPAGVIALCAALKSEQPKQDCLKEAIPEFMQFNIVESEVDNIA